MITCMSLVIALCVQKGISNYKGTAWVQCHLVLAVHVLSFQLVQCTFESDMYTSNSLLLYFLSFCIRLYVKKSLTC